MKTTAAGPSGNYMAGNTYPIEDQQAKEFVEGGYAEYLDEPKEEALEETPISDEKINPDKDKEPSYQELKAKAKELEISGYNRMNKETLEAAIEAKLKEIAEKEQGE